MEWFKKHVDTVIILGAFGASILWMNGKFNEIHLNLDSIIRELEKIKVALIEK
jgi:hypothetical protein